MMASIRLAQGQTEDIVARLPAFFIAVGVYRAGAENDVAWVAVILCRCLCPKT